MPIDPRMRDAILEAVRAAGQPRGLADKLIAWFEALSSGNETLENRDSVTRHVQLLYSLTVQGQPDHDDDGEA